jgi:uncharacterized protein (DUF486 family)
MRFPGLMMAIFLAVVICFVGYCYALYDWFTDLSTGVYSREPLEAFYETSALVVYHAYSAHFLRQRQEPK